MTVFNKFNVFAGDLGNKIHNLSTDVLKVMLTDTAPVATNTVKSNITEITAANGYAAGGNVASFVSWSQASGVWKLVIGQPTFTASGGSIAQFRYPVLYNSTAAGLNLIGWMDYGAEINVTNGNGFQVQFDQTNGVLTIT
jgi:hypothetical protein